VTLEQFPAAGEHPAPPTPPTALPARQSSSRVWESVNDYFQERSPRFAGMFATVLTLLLGLGDMFTGAPFHFTAFYLLPLWIVSWWGEDETGTVVAVVSAAVATGISAVGAEPRIAMAIVVWNFTILSLTFIAFVKVVVRLEDAIATQRHLAYSDPLTGLANGRAFFRHLASEIDRCRRYQRTFTLAYLDLDHFKAVNDTRGHAEGDRLLRELAGVLRSSTRITDFSARLGGDEFGLLFPETSHERAAVALQKVTDQVDELMQLEGWPVTLSIGAVTFEQPPATADEAIRVVDHLMYRVKREGRDGVRHARWSGNGSAEDLASADDQDTPMTTPG
jgi:diguanylate cyclase (GGDEF)-like protein